jgi:glycosyltransferase involved in cell wall biosynthesis
MSLRIASLYDFRAFPPKGGNHVHALQLMRRFQAAGHQVLTWGDDTVPGVEAVPRSAEGLKRLETRADVLYLRVDANRFTALPDLAAYLSRTQVPTVWEINAPANESQAFSWLGGTRPRVVSGLGSVTDQWRRRLHAAKQLPTIVREERLRRALASRAYGAVCVSQALARYAAEGLGMSRTLVLPNGADEQEWQVDGPVAALPPAPEGTLSVLYAGSPMYPWQGLDVLEQTIALCAAKGDPVRFVLLLNQPSPRPLHFPNVLTYERVPHHEVASFLRAADVGVAIHPEYFWSRWGFHGSPMKMFDYMACGLPVVASDHGQMRDLLQHGQNGLLFDNTPAGLRRVLLEVAAGRHDLSAIRTVARTQVEQQYNWRENARRTIEMFDQAIAASNA